MISKYPSKLRARGVTFPAKVAPLHHHVEPGRGLHGLKLGRARVEGLLQRHVALHIGGVGQVDQVHGVLVGRESFSSSILMFSNLVSAIVDINEEKYS